MEIPSDFKNAIEALAVLQPAVNGLTEALESTPPVTAIRVNRLKTDGDPAEIAGVAIDSRVPWNRDGFTLSSRPVFTFDPAFHQGLYYVQDPSSMFIGHVIKSLGLSRPVAYLDACAAPGGKTTAAIAALPEGSLVVANEWDYRRAEILKENVMKWGYPNVIISRGDTARFSSLDETFDIIAADVPCSGEGMMRKDSDAVAQWSLRLIGQCVERQKEILINVWNALKPGGYLIYSTCTFNRDENECMLDFLVNELNAVPTAVPVENFQNILHGIDTSYPCYRFMPHRVDGEGLFMALLRKPGEYHEHKAKKSKPAKTQKLPVAIPDWFPASLTPRFVGDTLYGISTQWSSLTDRLSSQLDVILQGIEIGTIKGHDLIPSQGLAMSSVLEPDSFTTVGVDCDTALAFLRRDAIILPSDCSRGYVLLMYGGHPLGWVKNIGNRSNNLYPTHWRVLKRE